MNDLTELHQNEILNLKQELASMEEKIAYQSYERARDIQVLIFIFCVYDVNIHDVSGLEIFVQVMQYDVLLAVLVILYHTNAKVIDLEEHLLYCLKGS